MRKLAALVLIFLGFHTAEKVCHQLTEGFSILRIQTNTPFNPALETSSKPVDALNQQFSYLGCGKQCYVFASEDGKYVLKLFKYGRIFPPSWTGKIPVLNKFKPFRQHRILKAEKKRMRDFIGYKIAFDEMPEETGLVCVHLNATPSGFPTIPLCDKLKIKHQLDLNKACFVLQKRAEMAIPKLKEWHKTGETEKIKQALAEMLIFCLERANKGICDDDAKLPNFGFLEGRVIETDPGLFCYNSLLKEPEIQKQDIARIQSRFMRYLTKTSPELIPYATAANSHL